jgi:tungstate transport system ATP-binding protein
MKLLYQVQKVSQVYQGRRVLHIDTLTIEAGEVLALVGPSGAGKSSLLRLLAFLERPTEGEVRLCLDGESTNTPSQAQLRRVGMVFQRPALLSRSVYENVAYGLHLRGSYTPEAVQEILKRLHLSHLSKAQTRTLSGGELQRVALARVLVTNPEVLLLDEPTANLDPYNVRLIEELLIEERQRRALSVLIVTHNLFQAKRLAGRMALLLEGELVEVGGVLELFDAPQDPRTRAFMQGEFVY